MSLYNPSPGHPMHPQSTPIWVFCIYAAFALIRIILDYLDRRDNTATAYMRTIRDKIDAKNKKDLEHLPGGREYMNLQWSWRYREYYKIPYKKMIYYIWRPLRNNIPPKLRKDLGM